MGSSGPMGLFAHNSAASGPREGGQKGRLLLFFPSFFAMMDWVCSTVQYYYVVLHCLHSGGKCEILLLKYYSTQLLTSIEIETDASAYIWKLVLIPILTK